MNGAGTTALLDDPRVGNQYPTARHATLTRKASAYRATGHPAALLDGLAAPNRLGEAIGLSGTHLAGSRHVRALRRGSFRRRLAQPRRRGA